MALIEGVVGGLAGAFFTLVGTELRRSISERKMAVVAIGTEVAHNLYLGCHILRHNVPLLVAETGQPWWELVAFSDSSWEAVVSSGALSRLKPEVIEALAKSYAELRKADYSAEKLQAGRVDTMKAKQYTVRTFDAAEAAFQALCALRDRQQYREEVAYVGQMGRAIEAWERGESTWRQTLEISRV